MDPKELKIVAQRVHIGNTPQVDAEGQTVVREFQTQAPAQMQNAGPGAAVSGNVGNIPAIFQYKSTAGEMADGARTACVGCRNWDHRAWNQFVDRAEGPASTAESRLTIQTWRDRIKNSGKHYVEADGGVEATLRDYGVCRVLSDWVETVVGRDPVFWPVVPFRTATCPPSCHAGKHTLNVVTPAEPFGFFSPVDTDAEKIGANRYDAILKAVDRQNKL